MSAALPATDQPSRQELFWLSAVIWAMCLVTFSLPGRGAGGGSGLDLLGLAKLGVRCGALVVAGYLWYRNTDHWNKRRVGWYYLPFVCYILWAFVSVAWSPLKTISIGQAMGLAALVALSGWIALSCREPAQVLFVTKHLWMSMLAFSSALLLLHLARPDLSGLTRDVSFRGANGVMHPTHSGATAAIGFLLTLLGPKLVKGFDLKAAFLPALVVHGVILFLANSRTALGLTAAISVLGFLKLYPRKTQAAFLLLAGIGVSVYLLFDPGFRLPKEYFQSGTEYLTRGQSQKQLKDLSGRSEMWQAVWKEYQKSPMIGHGYFVTSSNGKLDVWEKATNHTAHNVVLQVLASTGAIGCFVFFIAFWRVGSAIWRLRWGDTTAKTLCGLLAMMGIWYVGWCQTCISFIGPILPESVAFFLLLGLGIGQAVRLQPDPSAFSQKAPIAS